MDASDPTNWTGNPPLRVVLSTAPPDGAQALATALVEAGAAACVNLIPGVRSIYRWQGAISNDPETLLLIKTTTDALPALRGVLRAHHSYEVPEIVALGAIGAAADYAAWVEDSTGAAGENPTAESEA